MTKTTPLAPRTPYTAVAEASLSTEKLSISAGSILSRLPSRPSISTSALELAPNVPIPRIQNSDILDPGSPLDCTEIIPGTRPPSILVREVAGVWICEISTLVTAPVRLTFFSLVPIPVITTSSICCESLFILIFRSSSSFKTRCSIFLKPINENMTTSPAWAVSLNAPSIFVLVPTPARSFRYTLTPGIGSFISSNTCPDMVNCFSCPINVGAIQKNRNKNSIYFFISIFFSDDY